MKPIETKKQLIKTNLIIFGIAVVFIIILQFVHLPLPVITGIFGGLAGLSFYYNLLGLKSIKNKTNVQDERFILIVHETNSIMFNIIISMLAAAVLLFEVHIPTWLTVKDFAFHLLLIGCGLYWIIFIFVRRKY